MKGKRILSIVMTLCLCLTMLPTVILRAEAATPGYTVSSSYKASSYYSALCNVKLTGNQREDIVNVALSQVGYREGSFSNDYSGADDGSYNNYTEYNYWYNKYISSGMPIGGEDAPWCATFVSWCAEQAGVPSSVLKRSTAAGHGSSYFNVKFYSGSSTLASSSDNDNYFMGYNYVPQKGDLFYTRSWSHVGLVVAVSGSYVITVEGNTNNSGSSQGNGVYRLTSRKISDLYFGVPNYSGVASTPDKPTINTNTPYYAKGASIPISWSSVTGNSYYWISIWKDDELVVDQSMGSNTKYTLENAGSGEYLFAVSANNSAGTSGTSRYSFLVGQAPDKTTTTVSKTAYITGDTIKVKWTAEIGTTYYWINVYKDDKLIVNKSMGTATSYTIENAEVGAYRVNVSANNGAGNSGGSVVSFTVSTMNAPSISSIKTHYETGQTVEVSWDAVAGASEYAYYLSEYPNEYAYTTNVSSGRVTTSKVMFNNLPNGRYSIFVCAVSAAGKHSDQSNWITFYVYNTDYIPVKTIESNGHLYALFEEEMSWDFAKILCSEMGGHLATVTSAQENSIITELISFGDRDAYWLGASNVVSGSYKTMGEPFKWITSESFTYTNWKSGEPSQSGEKASLEHFLEIRKSYDCQWNDTSNTNKKNKGFILEIDNAIYTVAYNANGGTDAPASQTKNHNSSILLSSTTPIKAGYKFKGWDINSTATKVYYEPGDKYSDNDNVTLYAVWEKVTPYAVEYDANGGTGAPDYQKKHHDETLILSSKEPTRTGYKFRGWSTSPTATKAAYHPGEQYNANAAVTLYAVWEPDLYIVIYNANGGTGGPSKQEKFHDVDLILSDKEPTRGGYIFSGWATSSTATKPTYLSGDKFAVNANTTLYAVWTASKYSIYYNANGGTGGPEVDTKYYDKALTLSDEIPSRKGHTFLGWATNSTATSVTYQPGDKFTTNATTTLYAVWKVNTYTVTYNANGGAGAPKDQTKTYGVDLTLSSTKPTRSGYAFLGWATSATATSVTYQPGDKFTTNTTTTLYAVWKINAYTVTYNANGGTGAPDKQAGVDLILSSDKPSRAGFTFIGWAISATADSASYQPGDKFTANADITLFAVWNAHLADVSITSWQYNAVNYAVEKNLMAGKGTDEYGRIVFDPNKPISREEFVQVLYNAEGKPSVSFVKDFTDVAGNGWYKNAVMWANENGIASGMGDGNFGVGKNITRQDLAMMLYKYAKLKGCSLVAEEGKINQFADGNKVAVYAKTAMDWAVTNGILSGKGTAGKPISTFRLDPAGTATRAECAAMLKNFMEAFGL